MADLSLWGSQIDIRNPGPRSEMQVTALKNGTFVAVWTGSLTAGNIDVLAQIYNADGTPLGSAFRVNAPDPSVQKAPSVTALADGGFAVAWEDYSNLPTTGSDIKVRLFNANGTDRGNEVLATISPAGNQISPHITSYGGGFVVSSKGFDGESGVRNALFDASGTFINEVGLVSVDYESQAVSDIIDALGGSLYAGKFISAALDSATDRIVLRAHSKDGATEIETISPGTAIDSVSVAALSGGRFVVTWKEENPFSSRAYSIKAAIYDAAGARSEIVTLVDATTEIKTPVIAALPDGGFVLAYEQNRDIRAQAYNANGNSISGIKTVHTDITGEQSRPTIAVLADGRFIVGWDNDGPSASQSLRTQILDGRFTPVAVNGTALNDQYVGTDQFGDILRGAGGNDTLWGGGGDDILNGGAGADSLVGGEGNDIVSYYVEGSTDAVIASLTGDPIDGDHYVSIEGLRGGLGNDGLTGNNGDNTLDGGDGNDFLAGGEGKDLLVGGAGDDNLRGGAGADTFYGGLAAGGEDLAWDMVSYQDAGAAITLNDGSLNRGEAEGDRFFSIDAFVGSEFSDTMIGGDREDVFYSGGGNDRLEGGAERDFLYGQGGNDVLKGGAGNDVINGDEGINTAVFSGARSQYTIGPKAADGTIIVKGPDGTDEVKNVRFLQFGSGEVVALSNAAPTSLSLSNAATVENAPLNSVVGNLSARDADGDKLTYSLAAGSSNAFAINGNSLVVAGPLDFETKPNHQVTILARDDYGGSTSLTVTLTVGNEMETAPFTIRGTARADVLSGENGHDTIYGSGGKDVLTGHGGKDVFVFDTRLNKRSNVDQVTDFRYQDDSFYLDNKYFTKLGSGTFSKPKKFKSDMFVQNSKAKDAEDRIVYDKKTGKLYYDQDGTGSKAQVQLATLTNKVKLSYQDFFVI
jgi:Ca2+-binding RTX toxin-like protein